MELSASLVGGVLLLIISLAYLVASSQSDGQRDHTIGKIPVIGARKELLASTRAILRSLSKTAEWTSEGYDKFAKRGSPYIVPTLDRGSVVVLPVSQAKTVFKTPDERLDVFGTLQEQIQAPYTIRDQRVIRDPFHRHLIPSQLTRHLDLLTEPMAKELEIGFQANWGTGSDWTSVAVWPACFNLVARAANTFLCGNPLCRNTKFLQSLEGQSTALFGGAMLVSITPALFRPITGYLVKLWCNYHARKISKICGPYIEERIKETRIRNKSEPKEDPPVDGLQLIIDEAISRSNPTEMAVDLLVDRLMIANNVTLYSVTFTIQHAILCIASSDPSLGYMDALREECENALKGSGGKWTLEVVRKLKLVDSTIRESMRIVPFSSLAIARTVMDPQGIAVKHGESDIVIPRGTILGLPIESIHYDESIYKDAQKFDLFRFVSLEGQNDGSKGKTYTSIKPTTSADDLFYGLGTTKNPCPGRFLAVHMMKLILAQLILGYDIEHTQVNFQPGNMLAMKVPKTDLKLKVRSRSDS